MKLIFPGLLLIAVSVSAIAVVVARHDARHTFIEIQTLEQTRDQLNEEWGRLQLEQSTWAMASRVEGVVRNELEMRTPTPEQLVLVPQ
ncbi:MAG: cell division protein FtsL [Gammaproteobacteria bacterium]